MSEQEPARDLRELLRIAEAAALAGAAVVRAGAGRARGEVDLKGRGDYVTEVDRDSEDAIIAVLRKRSPDIQLLAEESGGDLTGDLVWVIDPLDGTTNFVHGFPAVAVSVALLSQGRPVVGVVAAPLLDQLYRAIAGQGAWSNDGARLQVRDADPRTAIVATGFPFRKPENRERYLGVFEPALEAFEDMRRAGAAALDLAWTAAGVFDGFFELGLGPWDVAAGALLVMEAGGQVTDWGGGQEFLRTGDILAAPREVHHELLRLAQTAASGRRRRRFSPGRWLSCPYRR